MYDSLHEQANIASNSVPFPDTNGNMDASELLKEKVGSSHYVNGNTDASLIEKFLVCISFYVNNIVLSFNFHILYLNFPSFFLVKF